MIERPILTVEGLEVRRGRRVIVRGLSFEHAPGSVVWVVGENGAGKTSLLRVLAGLELPTAGRVQRRGGPEPQAPPTYFHPDMRLPERVRVTDWQALVARLGLPERETPGLVPPFARAGVTAAELSTGEEKRLALDALLSNGRAFVFLDEPFEHLSPEGKDLLADRMRRLAEDRVVVVATNQAIPGALEGGPTFRLEPAEGDA